MSRKLLIAFVVVVALLAAGYWYWKSVRVAPLAPEQASLNKVGDAVKAVTDSATRGVLPTLNIQANPLSNVPDVNPVTKTNPYSDIKTNPFK